MDISDAYLKSYTLCRDVLHLDDFNLRPQKKFPTNVGIDDDFATKQLFRSIDDDDFCQIKLHPHGYLKGEPVTLASTTRIKSGHTINSIMSIGDCCWQIYK